jgi:hypothetical protein
VVPINSSATPLTQTTSGFYTPTLPGEYYWTASYSGDTNFPGNDISCDQARQLVVLCIHASSKVDLANGDKRPICELKKDDLIIAADGNIVPVVEVIRCWLTPTLAKKEELCLIFEKDSIETGFPSERFAVDPGHPICTRTEYNKHGKEALKPAKKYFNILSGSNRYTDWNKLENVLPDPQYRYDLVLPADSCGAYIANGMIVQARANIREPGYQYL